jgi:hypothetical protein
MNNYKYEYIKNEDGISKITFTESHSFVELIWDKIKMIVTLPLAIALMLPVRSYGRTGPQVFALKILKYGTKKFMNHEELIVDSGEDKIYRTKDGYYEDVVAISKIESINLTDSEYRSSSYMKAGIPIMLRIEFKTWDGYVPAFFTIRDRENGAKILEFLSEEVKSFYKNTGRGYLIG